MRPDQVVATNPGRWGFYHQLNPGAEELCYTGVSLGGFDLVISAVRG